MGLYPGVPAAACQSVRSVYGDTLRADWLQRGVKGVTCRAMTMLQFVCLCRRAFQHYVAQDAYFLKAFAQAYALALAQTTESKERSTLQRLLDGVHEELKMHKGYAKVITLHIRQEACRYVLALFLGRKFCETKQFGGH